MHRTTPDWEFLLRDPGPPPPAVPRASRLLAAARTARAARILHRYGWPRAQQYLRTMRPLHTMAPDREPALRLAHREVQPCLTVLRVVEPNALCLPRSYALAVHLSALGLPAEVVIARQRTSVGARFAFHAWAELHGEVLADIPGVQSGFTVLQRVGAEQLLAPRGDLSRPGAAR